jgi:hypothetical protein
VRRARALDFPRPRLVFVPSVNVAHYAARHHEDLDQGAQVLGNACFLLIDPVGGEHQDSLRLFRVRGSLTRSQR